jgi:SAM-dependent methyltransferase
MNPLARYLAGELAAPMALMALAMDHADDAALAATLAAAAARLVPDGAEARRMAELRALQAAHPRAVSTVRAVLGAVPHGEGEADPAEALARIAGAFDRAAEISPEAGVALYSLGDRSLLDAATADVVAGLEGLGVLAPGRTVLEIGCGIGRFAAALAGRVAGYAGVDVSAGMIGIARDRCARLPATEFAVAAGHDLSVLGERRFDVVLAVDSFPYVVQAGGDLPARTIAEASRRLHAGGDLVVLNWSYRSDPDADVREARALAAAHGLSVVRIGPGGFRCWDGRLFHLRKG